VSSQAHSAPLAPLQTKKGPPREAFTRRKDTTAVERPSSAARRLCSESELYAPLPVPVPIQGPVNGLHVGQRLHDFLCPFLHFHQLLLGGHHGRIVLRLA